VILLLTWAAFAASSSILNTESVRQLAELGDKVMMTSGLHFELVSEQDVDDDVDTRLAKVEQKLDHDTLTEIERLVMFSGSRKLKDSVDSSLLEVTSDISQSMLSLVSNPLLFPVDFKNAFFSHVCVILQRM
jgi:hypothetical protein